MRKNWSGGVNPKMSLEMIQKSLKVVGCDSLHILSEFQALQTFVVTVTAYDHKMVIFLQGGPNEPKTSESFCIDYKTTRTKFQTISSTLTCIFGCHYFWSGDEKKMRKNWNIVINQKISFKMIQKSLKLVSYDSVHILSEFQQLQTFVVTVTAHDHKIVIFL